MLGPLVSYLYGLVYPTPPAGAAYGFQWQPSSGVPAALSTYDIAAGTAGPGIYVTFNAQNLDNLADPFGRSAGGPGPVFGAPTTPSAAVATLIQNVQSSPPPSEAAEFLHVTTARLCDITAFLNYTANCLDLINRTVAGAHLLQQIPLAAYPVFITPANVLDNQTFAANNDRAVNLLIPALRNYLGGQPIPGAQITALVNQVYGSLGAPLHQFNQFAADLNNLPLCSLFVMHTAFTPNFLGTNFTYNAAPMTGQDLMAWLSPAGLPAFDLNLRAFSAVMLQNVKVSEFFLLALGIVLNAVTASGGGCGAGIKFNVRNEGDNVGGSPTFRPPAVGLGHELVHAMYYGQGTAPGYPLQHFTTTAAELLFTGLNPFAAVTAISDNAIRQGWAAIPAALISDLSNVWAAPWLRTTYDLPVPPDTPASMRASMRCI